MKAFFVAMISILISWQTAQADGLCSQVFVTDMVAERHQLVQQRALAIIGHQNWLRERKGLPVFESKDYAPNLRKKPPATISSDRRYIVVKEHLVLIDMNEQVTSLSLQIDDVHSLNYVYRFDGAKLIEAIPASVYYISQMPEVVTLTRSMSGQERQLWQNGELAALRSHPRAIKYGYPEPGAHFSVLVWGSAKPTLSAKIPREVLLKWAKQEFITIGSEGDKDGKPHEIEIVIKDKAWEELLPYLQ